MYNFVSIRLRTLGTVVFFAEPVEKLGAQGYIKYKGKVKKGFKRIIYAK